LKVSHSRITSREGVNAAQAFFESNGCVFQEVAQQNDYGKDGYVDIARSGVLTPLCVAVQIKSGESYRASGGDYLVPIEGHASNWRRSTVPVFGLVYDPADRLLRWADLTAHLRDNPEQEEGSIPVSREAVLTPYGLGYFVSAASKYVSQGGSAVALQLLASVDALQADAVFDAWALGRHDARHLILLRRVILELRPIALRRAIHLLSHAGSHPDILWTPTNWIPRHVEEQVLPSFRWSAEEVAHMIRVIDLAEWGRGTLGQSFDVLVYEDPNIVRNARAAVGILLEGGNDITIAVRAATITLSHSREARRELGRLLELYPVLSGHEWFGAIAALVEAEGQLSLY
jgi:hypothetical protein